MSTESDASSDTTVSKSVQPQICKELTLTTADQPYFQLSPVKFDGSNWISWRVDVRNSLRIKAKEKFIYGTFPIPPADDPLYDLWIQVDCLVLTWLRNSLTPDISAQFVYTETSHELWSELEESYGQTTGPQIILLWRKLVVLTQGNRSVTSYYNDLKIQWRHVRALKPFPKSCSPETLKALLESDEHDLLVQFLTGLNEDYTHVTNQILLMNPLPPVNKAFSMVCGIEAQKGASAAIIGDSGSVGFALATVDKNSTEKRGSIVCTYCKKTGHTREKCFQLANKNATCEHCKKKGHTKANCFQLSGVVPDWYKALNEKGRGKPSVGAVAGVTIDAGSPDRGGRTVESSQLTDSARIAKIEEMIEKLARTQGGAGSTNPVDYIGATFHMAGPEI